MSVLVAADSRPNKSHTVKLVAVTLLTISIVTITPTQSEANALRGGLIGAGGGALFGALVGGGRGAAVGAIVGGIVGVGVGARRADERRARQRMYHSRRR
jgi:outer membrane lipoprotein SlyB